MKTLKIKLSLKIKLYHYSYNELWNIMKCSLEESSLTEQYKHLRWKSEEEAAERSLSDPERDVKHMLEETSHVHLSGYPEGTLYLPDRKCGDNGPRNHLADSGLRTWRWYLATRKSSLDTIVIGGRKLSSYPEDVAEDYKDFVEHDCSTEMFVFHRKTGNPMYVAQDKQEYAVTCREKSS
jgi:hypothetical protein